MTHYPKYCTKAIRGSQAGLGTNHDFEILKISTLWGRNHAEKCIPNATRKKACCILSDTI